MMFYFKYADNFIIVFQLGAIQNLCTPDSQSLFQQ